MEHRVLGRTGLEVSKLALGGAQLGGIYGNMTEELATDIVHACLDQGINLIDTAPFYGMTRSEVALGKALKGIARDKYVLATKCGRYGDDWFDFSADRVTRSIDESLSRLGIETIDVFQVHDSEHRSYQQVIDETLPALEKARQSGKIRFIGVTGLPLKLFHTILPAYPVDTIISYSHYTLVNTTLTTLFPLLDQQGIGLMNGSPVGLGLLSPQGPQPWHPGPEHLKRRCAAVVAKWQAKGVSLAKLSLQYSMANPKIHTTLAGMANLDEVSSAVAASHKPIDQELLAEVLADFAPVKDTTWTQGRAENN